MIIHFLFHAVDVLSAYHKAMQRRAHIDLQEGLHLPRTNKLVGKTDSCQSEAFSGSAIGTSLPLLFNLQQLRYAFLDRHESRWFEYVFILDEVLFASLLDLDVN